MDYLGIESNDVKFSVSEFAMFTLYLQMVKYVGKLAARSIESGKIHLILSFSRV